MHKTLAVILGAAILVAAALILSTSQADDTTYPAGNVVFIHPDGSGAAMWGALRIFEYGPDSSSNWDRMSHMGLYRTHLLNSSNASSNGGATIHAFGVKVPFDYYGSKPSQPIKALSGADCSILIEAHRAGHPTAIINSGHICEPGTGVFAASAEKRSMTDTISSSIIRSGVDIIMSGGEAFLLPKGTAGRFAEDGRRSDGQNLIDTARALGYKVIYTRDELFALTPDDSLVLGVFAAGNTFNARAEERLRDDGLPLYWPDAPTIAEMTEVALKLLSARDKHFIMVVEEEGTDNFANSNNADGTFEAMRRADQAIGVVMAFIDDNPNTLLVTAADSDAGGMQVVSIRDHEQFEQPLPSKSDNGAPLDGVGGTGGMSYVAKPDRFGTELHFAVAWSCYDDVAGSIIARAHGLNAALLPTNVDNTDIYRLMYMTLFGRDPKTVN